MYDDEPIPVAVWWVLCGLAVLFFAWDLPAFSAWRDDSNSPAWLQAIGSIVAIAATGWGVERSHRLTMRLAKARDLEAMLARLRPLEALLREMSKQVHETANNHNRPQKFFDETAPMLTEQLSAAVATTWPDWKLTAQLATAQRKLDDAVNRIRAAWQPGAVPVNVQHGLAFGNQMTFPELHATYIGEVADYVHSSISSIERDIARVT